jgi:multiple sugar transport system substrate-binding protein
LEAGQVFSVPMLGGSATFIFANRSMLEEAGLDPTVVPADTEEFLDVMTTVYEATGKGITYGGKFQDLLRGWVVNPLAITACGPEYYANVANGVEGYSFTDECVANAFKFVGDITERGLWMPGTLQLLIDEADVAFSQGQAAFLVGGSYTLGFLIAQGMDPADIVVYAQPPLPDAIQKPMKLAPFALIDVMVTKDSEHPEEAIEFLRFMTQPEQMTMFAQITGDFPATALPADPAVVGELMAGLAKAYEGAEESLLADPAWPPLITLSETWGVIDAIVNKQITGEDTLENLLLAADEAVRYDRSLREGG